MLYPLVHILSLIEIGIPIKEVFSFSVIGDRFKLSLILTYALSLESICLIRFCNAESISSCLIEPLLNNSISALEKANKSKIGVIVHNAFKETILQYF